MQTLVAGSNGLLGSNVVAEGDYRNHRVLGTYHSTEPDLEGEFEQFDLRDTERYRTLLEENEIGLLVNCGALTDVDRCENNPQLAHEVNGDAPGDLASLCDEFGVDFIHVSTDYVFDGVQEAPYDETDSPNPIQEYGASKLTGDNKVLNANSDALIVRPSFVYGIHRSSGGLTGFPAWVRDQLESGNEPPLFVDQYVTPSRARQVARTMFELHEVGASGIVNVASRSCVTPYRFGKEIVTQLAVSGGLNETAQSDVERDAPRPAYTCLDVGKVERMCQRRQPTLTEDLVELFAKLDYS
jgi:dTDP-4-dehydrorhamnose reductase